MPTVNYANEGRLADDEKAVLAIIRQVCRDYRIADRPGGGGKLILLTGFSSGGFPLYTIGVKHAGLFDMLIARDCNYFDGLMNGVTVGEAARRLPIVVFWGKDDLTIRDQSWKAFRWLRENGCKGARQKIIEGGHLVAPGHKVHGQMGPHKPATACDQNTFRHR